MIRISFLKNRIGSDSRSSIFDHLWWFGYKLDCVTSRGDRIAKLLYPILSFGKDLTELLRNLTQKITATTKLNILFRRFGYYFNHHQDKMNGEIQHKTGTKQLISIWAIVTSHLPQTLNSTKGVEQLSTFRSGLRSWMNKDSSRASLLYPIALPRISGCSKSTSCDECWDRCLQTSEHGSRLCSFKRVIRFRLVWPI